MIDDYSRGIIWATAYLAKENGKQYIFARNIDKWPIEYLAKKAGVNVYQGKSGKNCAKCRKITEFPKLNEISNKSDFLRGYIEIHGIIDIWKNKKKKEKLDEVDLAQMSLFDTVKDDDILEELKNVDLSNMTPIDALNKLYELQNKIKNRW